MDQKTRFMNAVTKEDLDLIKESIDQKTRFMNAFMNSFIKNDLDLIKECLDSGFDVEQRFYETHKKYYELMRIKGINIIDGGTPLYIATHNNKLEVVKLLVSYGAKIDNPSTSMNITPLFLAIIMGNYEIASFLINEGADIHQDVGNGYTTPYKKIRAQKKGVKHALHREKCDELLLLIEKLYGGGINTKSCK